MPIKYNNKKEWLIFNATDGFYSDPNVFTKKQAERFIANFPKHYETQGYYRDKNMNKIDPKHVKLIILKEGTCPL